MPTDPNHKFVDVAHPKMVVSSDWRYGCHSDKIGTEPRGMVRVTWVQGGWRTLVRGEIVTREPVMVEVETQWNPVICGHIIENGRGPDDACKGCVREQS